MNATLFILPLAGAAMLAAAAEPPKSFTSDAVMSLSAKTTTEPAREAGTATATDPQATKSSERLGLAAALTLKAPRPAGGPVLSLFNPLAPVAAEPTTRWASRSPWVAVSGMTGKVPSATEVRHEPRFGVVLCSR